MFHPLAAAALAAFLLAGCASEVTVSKDDPRSPEQIAAEEKIRRCMVATLIADSATNRVNQLLALPTVDLDPNELALARLAMESAADGVRIYCMIQAPILPPTPITAPVK